MGFLKPHIQNQSLLESKLGDPDGYVTNDGMWAAIPWAGNKKGFCIIHNGKQVHSVRHINRHFHILKSNLKLNSHPLWRIFYDE